MFRKRSGLYCILTLLFLLIPGHSSFAQRQAESSLEGLTTIHVRVQLKSDSDAKGGPTAEQFQSDVESLLEEAGLKVVSQEEFERLLRSRGYPVALFDLDATITKPSDVDFHICIFNFKVRQAVFLVRKPAVKFLASTWELNSFGTTNSLPALREKVKQAANQFIQHFKAENPK